MIMLSKLIIGAVPTKRYAQFDLKHGFQEMDLNNIYSGDLG